MIKIEINKTQINLLKKQRRTIGLLKFETRDDQNFTKWFSLTENLIIKSFSIKSNQIIQLRNIRNKMSAHGDLDFGIRRTIDSQEAKEKFKDLLTVFIEELELDLVTEPFVSSGKGKNISIKMNSNQTINQTINLSINNIIETIRQNEPDEKKVKEAEIKLGELDKEIKSKNPAWAKIKDILIWCLNFSRDTFLQVLPIILEKYK